MEESEERMRQAWVAFVQEAHRRDQARAPWAPRPTLRELVGRVVGSYALGLAALADWWHRL